MAEKHRCRPGYTHDPWPCCGAEEGGYRGRPKGTICTDCKALIKEAQAARVLTAQVKEAGELAVYHWTSADYGWPRLYGRGIPSDEQRALEQSFWELVNRCAKPAPAGTPSESPTYTMQKRWDGKLERRYDLCPFVLDKPKGQTWSHDTWSFVTLVLMPPAVRDALAQLYLSIFESTGAAYRHGKSEGLSVLQGLASGEVSLADFDEALVPAGERRRR